MFELADMNDLTPHAKIKVIGVGGAGGNVINNMIASNIRAKSSSSDMVGFPLLVWKVQDGLRQRARRDAGRVAPTQVVAVDGARDGVGRERDAA